MANQNQGSGGKQKISLAPVKALSQPSAKPEATGPAPTTATVSVASKPVVAAAAAPKPTFASSPLTAAVPAPAVAMTPVIAQPAKPVPAVDVAAKPAAVSPVIAKADAPKPALASPAPEARAAAAFPAANKLAEAVAAPKVAKAQASAAMSFSIIPLHPGLTDFDAEMWMAPAINAFRAFAAVQVKVLEHARAEFQASMTEAEALARVASPSEAVAVQTQAFSRRLHASSAHFADLAMVARKTGKAA